MKNTELQREHKNLLIGLSKYFINLKDHTAHLREKAESKDSAIRANSIMSNAAIWEMQSKAILWMINRQRSTCIEYFGTDLPEEIQHYEFENTDLEFIDKVKPEKLGVTCNLIDRQKEMRRELNIKLVERLGSAIQMPLNV